MSLLTAEQQQEFLKMASSGADEAAAPEGAAADHSQHDQQQADQEASQSAQQQAQQAERQAIPYERFAKEVKKRRELENRLANLEGRLSATQSNNAPEWLQEPQQEVDPIESRLVEVERFRAETQLDRIVSGVRAADSRLPENFVYQAIAAGAKSQEEVLNAWQEIVSLVGSQGQPQTQQRAAAPAPPSVKPAPRTAGPVQPKTMAEAAVALRQYLQSNMGQ
jgi:hypothetical protein